MAENYLLSMENRMRVCAYCSKNLRRLRKNLKMNQKELAVAVGTTQRHISEIENGKAKVSWTLMLALSTIYLLHFNMLYVDDAQASEEGAHKLADGELEFETMLRELKMELG